MVCSKCFNQMQQWVWGGKAVGEGNANDEIYVTREVKYCEVCNRFVEESYFAEEISQDKAIKLAREWKKEV